MNQEKKYKLDEDGEPEISLCSNCNCMTKSVDVDGTHFVCGKCGATK